MVIGDKVERHEARLVEGVPGEVTPRDNMLKSWMKFKLWNAVDQDCLGQEPLPCFALAFSLHKGMCLRPFLCTPEKNV
jgi:hypothetical protein